MCRISSNWCFGGYCKIIGRYDKNPTACVFLNSWLQIHCVWRVADQYEISTEGGFQIQVLGFLKNWGTDSKPESSSRKPDPCVQLQIQLW